MAYVGLEFQIWNRQRNDHWKVETLSERRYTNGNWEIADKNIRGLMGGQNRMKLFVFQEKVSPDSVFLIIMFLSCHDRCV